jgi:thiamine-phosphate pyrophosphorylase
MTAGATAERAPRVLLIVDVAAVTTRSSAIAAALAAGVDAIQLRDRRVGGGALFAAAVELRVLTRGRGARLLVNDRIDVALAAGADGVHLPAASFPIAAARRLVGPEAWIGRSTHAPDEAARAAAEGADYVVVGPIFATPSKRAFGAPLGVTALEATARIGCPVVAIGGITPTELPALRTAGAHGVAIIRAVLDADDPAAVAGALVAGTAASN